MKEQNLSPTHLRRGDILLIAAILLISLLFGVYLFAFRPEGDTVRVTIDGKLYGVYAIDEDRIEEIYTAEDTARHNRLVIRDGKAYMESASCPDGICVGHRPISRSGESIVCLPNRVVVTVTAGGQNDAPDIVA